MSTTAIDYFHGNELAANVWASKYALKKNKEQLEQSPEEMHRRMAKEFARIEKKYNGFSENIIYDLLKDFKAIIPQGSVMSQLGNPHQIGSLSNCIVLPKIHDSYGGICYTDQQLAQVMKRRCGAGIDISTLRPTGTSVSNAAQSSTGAVSFMHRFSNTTREVAQDGRRGALMISQDIRHPEAGDFAQIKQDLSKVTGANISLKLTDDFMRRVEADADFLQCFPVEKYSEDSYTEANDTPYNKLEMWANAHVKKVRAKELWNLVIKCAHGTAEPGLLFWDRQHYYSPSSLYKEFENIGTNPCSEIAMGNDSCRLIAKNMFSCVEYPFTYSATFDFDSWYSLSYYTMILMDDMVDLELEHVDRILAKIDKDEEPEHIKAVERKTWTDLSNSAIRGRRTGTGFTALGDTLAALGLRYGSKESQEMLERIMHIKLRAELDATIDMAMSRGAFPAFDAKLEAEWAKDQSTFFYFIKNEYPAQWERMQKYGRRNISWSTIAPTGSLSLLARLSLKYFGTTSGIEPLFKVYYTRRKKINPNDKDTRVDFVDSQGDKWQEFPIFHEGFKMWWEINKEYLYHGPITSTKNSDLETMTKEEIDSYIKMSPYYQSTAEEINWKDRVHMQAICQKYITHSISSTINLPSIATEDEVSQIYLESWRQGLKGITIYRDGSRSGVLVTTPTKKQEEGILYTDAPKRPGELDAELHIIRVKGIKYAVLIGFLDNKPYEVFAFDASYEGNESLVSARGIIRKDKKNYTFVTEDNIAYPKINKMALHADEQMLTRLVSGMLRHGVNPKFIIEQIDKCPLEIVSFGKALARVIKKYIPEKELLERFKCKDCGSSNVRFEEGCAKCLDCGSSKCG
jgi:ribonucleoside-diphosphate reductase alpha chain